jgi:hypothetical protein
MRSLRWTVVAKTSPADPEAARQQERWLKLGDDALSNRKINDQEENVHVLRPGGRARNQLKAVARELQDTVRKYLK